MVRLDPGGCVIVWMWGAAAALAERPLSYSDALQASVERSVLVVAAEAQRGQSAASLTAAMGSWDPLYQLDGSWRQSTSQGFFQGFPFDSNSRRWSLNNSVSGTAGTGTTYAVNLGVDRDISRFTTDFGVGGGEQLQDAFTGRGSVSVTQQLLRGVLFRYNAQNQTRARAGLDVAELTLAKQHQEALYQAAEAYWTWSYQHQLHQIAAENVAVAEEAHRVGALQVDSGQLAPVEGTRLEAALVQAQQSALDARNLAEKAANALLIAMGEDPQQSIVPSTEPGDVATVEGLAPEAAVGVALSQNLDLAIARRNNEQSELELHNARHGMLPRFSATGSAGLASQRCPPGTDNEDCVVGNALQSIAGLAANDNQPFVELSGQLQVPLGNRGARGERERVAALVDQRQSELAHQERLVSAQVEEQVRALKSAEQRTSLADTNLRLAEETLAAEEALANAGRTLQKDVLEARNQVGRAKAEAAKARTDYRLAQALLLKLQGQLTEAVP